MYTYIRSDHFIVPRPIEPLRTVGNLAVMIHNDLEGEGGLAASTSHDICPHRGALVPAYVGAVDAAHTAWKSHPICE
jgi:hypothetical protein